MSLDVLEARRIHTLYIPVRYVLQKVKLLFWQIEQLLLVATQNRAKINWKNHDQMQSWCWILDQIVQYTNVVMRFACSIVLANDIVLFRWLVADAD